MLFFFLSQAKVDVSNKDEGEKVKSVEGGEEEVEEDSREKELSENGINQLGKQEEKEEEEEEVEEKKMKEEKEEEDEKGPKGKERSSIIRIIFSPLHHRSLPSFFYVTGSSFWIADTGATAATAAATAAAATTSERRLQLEHRGGISWRKRQGETSHEAFPNFPHSLGRKVTAF